MRFVVVASAGLSCSRDISPFQGSTFIGSVTQGYGDTASKKRSPAASTLGWYISPLWGLDLWPFETLRSIRLLRSIKPCVPFWVDIAAPKGGLIITEAYYSGLVALE